MFAILKIRYRQSVVKRTGFTLVELLVVISIIALLLSILMPAMGKARKKAQSVVCMSNQRQIGLGMQLYLQDNRGTFMLCYGDDISQKGWFTRLVKDGKLYSDNTIAYISGYDVLFCPSHRLAPQLTAAEKRNYPKLREYSIVKGYISYGMSSGLTYDYSQAGYPVSPAKIQDIRQPANTILLVDASHKESATRTTGTFFVRPYYQVLGWDVASIRHEGACNALWVDGHVTPVKAPNPKDEKTIYYQTALTDYSMGSNYWDRK